MPVTPTYPGVYVEEIPSPVRTIVGVSTSATAFVGYTSRGPTNEATHIFNFGEYERTFGGLDSESRVSYAVQQFFQNGGGEAWIVRVAADARRAAVNLLNEAGGDAVLAVRSSSEGTWANRTVVGVDYDTTNPLDQFNLTVTEHVESPTGDVIPGRTETYRNLSMSSTAPTFAVDTINANSALVEVEIPAGVVEGVDEAGTSTSGSLAAGDLDTLDQSHRRLAITVNGQGPMEFNVATPVAGADLNARITALANDIQAKVRALRPGTRAFDRFTAARSGDRIVATSGDGGVQSSVRFTNAAAADAAAILKLGLANGGEEQSGAAGIRPAATGTVGSAPIDMTNLPATGRVRVRLRRGDQNVDAGPGEPATSADLTLWEAAPTTRAQVAQALEAALHGNPREELKQADVDLIADRLRIVPGGADPNVSIVLEPIGDQLPIAKLLGPNPQVNVAGYTLGLGMRLGAQGTVTPGSDGRAPSSQDLIGNQRDKQGIFALEDVEIFNLMSIPGADENVLAAAIPYCERKRAFLIMDMPESVRTVDDAKDWLSDNNLRHKNAATYFPWVLQPDPLQNFRQRPFPPSGAIAGLYARTDGGRGVWKAPAGIEAGIGGVRGLTYKLSDGENGVLNQVGVNCLRSFPIIGTVAWGARTANGSDAEASEWKYIPVRRVALYIEQSLYRGTQYAVFEPNDEPLWSSIRMNVGAFMQNLFRAGAFQGASARDAFLVKCDSETTTQNDINLGIVNIIVGFAPLKPAEFVILKISQLAGQVQT